MSEPNQDLWDDPRITTYVMNEMTPEETVAFESEMEADPQLAAAVNQARTVSDRLTTYFQTQNVVGLDKVRRDSILQPTHTDTEAHVERAKKTVWMRPLVQLAVVASIMVVVAGGLMLPANLAKLETAQAIVENFAGRADNVDAEVFAPEPVNAPEIVREESRYVIVDSFAMESKKQSQSENWSLDVASGAASDGPASMPEALNFQREKLAGSAISSEQELALGQTLHLDKAAKDMPVASVEASDRFAVKEEQAQTFFDPMPTVELSTVPSASRGLAKPGSPPVSRFETPTTEFSGMPAILNAERDLKEITDVVTDEGTGPGSPGDQFDPIDENEFQRVGEHPLSTFSIDVDTASYSKVRDYLLRAHQLPRPAAVRIEEMLNYFDYQYAAPANDASDPFAATVSAVSCPWTPEHRLVRIGIQAKTLTPKERPRCNLVFLIDTSGSMQSPEKLPLVIEGLELLLKNLRKNDRVAIVTYAGSAGLVLDSTPVRKSAEISRALQNLAAGGSTNGGAGLQLAYDTARENFIKDGVNRVILCSDGDFNVGMTGTDALVEEAKTQSKSGVELTVLGYGMGNHNDAMMERISNSGAGNYGYIDSIAEAHKVLADQLTGTLVTVAKDVKIQVEFNPAVVSAYRLIGYENRKLAKEDFNDDKKDAGEIGAGHRVTALYEIVPAGVEPNNVAPAVDPLKYQATAEAKPEATRSSETLTLKLRYKAPQGDESKLIEQPLVDDGKSFDQADEDFRFATAVAGFAMQLRNSANDGNWTLADVLKVAKNSVGDDEHGLRAEFVQLVEIARTLTVSE